MKEKIKKIYTSNKIPFIILFFAILFANFLKTTNYGDDLWFGNITNGEIQSNINSIADYIPWRYKTWSSRLIIETFLIIFTRNFPIIWRILDSFIYVILAYSLSKVFGKKESSVRFNWIITLLILCIPFELMASAGWVATSLNYSWPIAFGIFSLIPIRKTINSEKIKKYEYPIYILACLYACNVEQVCLCILVIYFIFNIYFICKKNIRKFNIIMLLIAILSIVFILTCPRKYCKN